MQILLDTFADETDGPQAQDDETITTDSDDVDVSQDNNNDHMSDVQISSKALLTSHSLVDVCLRHVCKYIKAIACYQNLKYHSIYAILDI